MSGKRYLDCGEVASLINVLEDLTFSVQGMNAFKTTCMEVTDTAIKLPAIAFNNRKSMSVYILSGGTLYHGPSSSVTADNAIGNTAGIPAAISTSFNVDFAGDVDVYGIAETGETILIKIVEYAYNP